ncbi:type II toxin-antitoxin system TacA family antitoxin [Eoetvoesiella caeni]
MQYTTEVLEKTRNARLETRVSSDQKNLFQRAAALSGRTLSEFVIDSTQEAAARIIKEHEIIRLTREEQEAFVTALLSPAAPGSRLHQAAKNYRMKTGL